MTQTEESRFVYVIFIGATPEKIWAALMDPALTARFWFGVHHETDWRPGAAWRLVFADGRVSDTGEIAEIDPPRRLVLKWRNEFMPDLKAEGYSTCVIELQPKAAATKLTVTHSIARPASKLIGAVSNGWPALLSNLKSLIETGEIVIQREDF